MPTAVIGYPPPAVTPLSRWTPDGRLENALDGAKPDFWVRLAIPFRKMIHHEPGSVANESSEHCTMRTTWKGVFPAATTAFFPNQELDLPSTLNHLGRLLQSGIEGLILLGTVGENCSLDAVEKRNILKAGVDYVAKRVPVLAGVAECTTSLACKFAVDAQKIGIDGLMVLPGMG